jgi:hypothetical protein
MNFLLMLASLMVLLVSVASDTTNPTLGTTRTFYTNYVQFDCILAKVSSHSTNNVTLVFRRIQYC